MVEVVVSAGAEVVNIHGPSTDRDRQANLMLLVAFSAQRQKSRCWINCAENISGNRIERRRLVVAAVCATQHPVQTWQLNGNPQTRTGRCLGDQSVKTREADTSSE